MILPSSVSSGFLRDVAESVSVLRAMNGNSGSYAEALRSSLMLRQAVSKEEEHGGGRDDTGKQPLKFLMESSSISKF